jgi:hypothetical protein
VPTCGPVNRSKGSATPKDFLTRSSDGKGKIIRSCGGVIMLGDIRPRRSSIVYRLKEMIEHCYLNAVTRSY